MLAAEPLGILSKDLSPQQDIHVLPHCNSQRTWPVPIKMQLGGGTSVIQFLCLLLRAVSHPNRDQDNNSPQAMKSYQNNPSIEENGPSGCIQESKPCGKSMQHVSYWNKPVLKAGGFQAASSILNQSWEKSAKTWATALITKLAVNPRAVYDHH